MGFSFDDAYRVIKIQGKEIGTLVKRGDKLACDLFNRYRDWYLHEGEKYNAWVSMPTLNRKPFPDSRRRRAVVSALEQYLQRDLMASERNELAGKKGHLLDLEKDVPSNLIHLSVARALRRH